jgi:hypothetical protein
MKFDLVIGYEQLFDKLKHVQGFYSDKKDKKIRKECIEYVKETWKTFVEEEYLNSQYYISAIFEKCDAVYNGSSNYGKPCVHIWGNLLRAQIKDNYSIVEWKEAIFRICSKLQDVLKEREIFICFSDNSEISRIGELGKYEVVKNY